MYKFVRVRRKKSASPMNHINMSSEEEQSSDEEQSSEDLSGLYIRQEVELVFEDELNGKQLIASLTTFATELYKEQARKKSSGNAFMSPLSISTVLNMALLGSRGKTLDEMKTTLFLKPLEDDSKLHQSFGDLISHLNRCSTDPPKYVREPHFQLHMANCMYAEKSYKVLDEFQASCKKYYNSEVVPLSFLGKPKKAAEEINSWVLKQTNEKIKDIISPHFINDKTRLILINAIYFKSAWLQTFEKSNTKNADFYVSPTKTHRVKMMYRHIYRAVYYKSSDLHCEILQYFYRGRALSMFILLPDKTSTLDAVEERLTADHLMNIDHGFINEELGANFWLPRFKLEETLDLNKFLGKMGVKSLFEKGSADLSGIDGTRELYASRVMHKAFVDVNEKGTEAAAATRMITLGGGSKKPEVVDFRVDRPFMFFIREERTKVILFLGRVVKPKYK